MLIISENPEIVLMQCLRYWAMGRFFTAFVIPLLISFILAGISISSTYAAIPPLDELKISHTQIILSPNNTQTIQIYGDFLEMTNAIGTVEILIEDPVGNVTKDISPMSEDGSFFYEVTFDENAINGEYHVTASLSIFKKIGTFRVVLEMTSEYDGTYDLKFVNFDETEKYVLIEGIKINKGQISSMKFLEKPYSRFPNEFTGHVAPNGNVYLYGPCYSSENGFGSVGYYQIIFFNENKIASGESDCEVIGTFTVILSPTGSENTGFKTIIPLSYDVVYPPDYDDGGGCLIATATYGSELAPQVQQLREIRDNSLLHTASGTSFMGTFNDFYYSFSPIIADYERENPMFREMVKVAITPMVSSLSILNYVDMDSDVEVLGYGISLIVLNGLMYVGMPIAGIIVIRKRF